MSRPLPPGDPHQLGPFRLMARLEETSAGIVYLAEDGDGRQVCVAVLTRGSAADAAARDRFRVAIHAEINGLGVGAPDAGAAPLVAAQPEGHAPWVATAYEPERVGAARFLDSVTLSGSLWRRRAARRHGPQFQPYWTGSTGPALARPAPVPVLVAAPGRPERGLVAAVLTLAGMLALMALLLLLLFACQPKVTAPRPAPVDPPSETYQPPLPPPPSVTPSPTPTRPPPTRTPPSDDGPGGGGGAI